MPNVYPAKVNRTVHYRTAIGGVMRWRPAVITGGIPATLNVTAASRTGGVVTLAVNNALTPGTNIVVILQDTTYNGVFRIATANGTTITYSQPGLPDDASGGTGTIQNADVGDLRVGHHGETYAGAVRRSGGRGALNVNWNDRWRPG